MENCVSSGLRQSRSHIGPGPSPLLSFHRKPRERLRASRARHLYGPE